MALNDGYENFHLMLYSDTEIINEQWLPGLPEGYFTMDSEQGERLLSIFSKNDSWIVSCKNPAYFSNVPLEFSFEIGLKDDQILEIDYLDRKYILYAEKLSSDSKIYHNYTISYDADLVIGRKENCDICYNNPCVSMQHASLKRRDGQWYIQDHSDDYGVFVNGVQTDRSLLKLGDVICIFGLRIIIGSGVISINNNVDNISVRFESQRIVKSISAKYYGERAVDLYDGYFNRLPRKRIENQLEPIVVEAPPVSIDQKQMPLILRMGSSMIMGGTAALSGNFTTLLSSVMLPFISSKYTEKQKQEYESLRLTKYTEYLENKKTEIEEACKKEKEYLNVKYPVNSSLINIVDKRMHLWERRVGDSDFLQIRLGTGTRLLSTPIDYPRRHFELESDELENKMYELVEEKHYIEDVPVVLSLTETRVCGLLGAKDQLIEYIKGLILQISTFHSYDEVKMVFLLNAKELSLLEEIRYLPHFWDDQKTIRFVATNESEVFKVGEYIKNQIVDDKDGENNLTKTLKKRPYFIIFAREKKLLESHEVFSEILQNEEKSGVSIIAAYNDLPKESQKIISLYTTKNNVCTTLAADGGEDEEFRFDLLENDDMKKSMRLLSNVRLKTDEKANEMPKMITFLDMFKVGRVEELNALKRWGDNNPIKSLATPVGVGTDGDTFTLDLHEKRQGPHGLVAGMTGSGKSEFIITYILSMAVNYHPDEVTFLLIDYKGGGLAGAFDNPKTGVRLPHLVGTITNLDGAAIQRSLLSIESELIRRQKLFNDVKSEVNEGTMDIYTYQKLYRAGRVSEPVPHLFIVSDEFAELKQQQPEFMDKLISAARIGRSLGVHLILATQKPSGVVNDQIRSNTKFRVCLRVQDRSDSMDMLKRPEGAELKDTGRFYLQVGYNEYFALGQSAWCGAQYEPQNKVITKKDDSIEFLDTIGQVVAKANPKVVKTDSGMKQIVAIVNYLYNISNQQDISSKKLWLDKLEENIYLSDLRKEYKIEINKSVSALIGLADDPIQQRQMPIHLDMQHNNNLLIVGDSGSGKSTFLQTLLYDLTINYSFEQLQYYIFDFSSRNLKLFEKSSHCGGFITDEREDEIDQMLNLINDIIVERRDKFSNAEVSRFVELLSVENLPVILVVVDDISAIEDMKKRSDFLTKFEDIMAKGPGYGIKVVYTINQINNCPTRLRRNTGEKIALRVRDKFVYSDILDKRCFYEPDSNPGRGMCVVEDVPLEFQVALAVKACSEIDRSSIIKNNIKTQTSILSNDNIKIRHFKRVNDDQSFDDFCNSFTNERIPLGFHIKDMNKVAIPLQQLKNINIYIGNEQGYLPLQNNLFHIFDRENGIVMFVKRSENSMFDVEDTAIRNYIKTFKCSKDDLSSLLASLTEIIKERRAFRDEYCNENNINNVLNESSIKKWRKYIREKSRPVFVYFESLIDVITQIDIETAGMLSSFFESCCYYNIYFINCFYHDDELVLQKAKYPNGESNASNDEESVEYIRRKELRHIWEGVLLSLRKDKFALFFGGRFDKQSIAYLPANLQSIKETCKLQDIGKFIMQYRGDYYNMIMPLTIESTFIEDEDERDIFYND